MISEIGLYGGTFSPPHLGHLSAARAFINQIKPDKFFIIPASVPPHKQLSGSDDPHMRLHMLHLAFFEETGCGSTIFIDDYEIKKEGVSYTCDTLEYYSLLFPAEKNFRLTFLCGTDMFLTLDKWKSPEKVFSLARIAFMKRDKNRTPNSVFEEKSDFYRKRFNASIIEITGESVEVSSTDIRCKIAAGESCGGLIDARVLAYIKENNLYNR